MMMESEVIIRTPTSKEKLAQSCILMLKMLDDFPLHSQSDLEKLNLSESLNLLFLADKAAFLAGFKSFEDMNKFVQAFGVEKIFEDLISK